MKKEIRQIEKGIVRITTIDERFYAKEGEDPKTGLPIFKFEPSVTYITAFYPKGKFFEEWLRKNGQESELIKQLAAEKGSRVHQACDVLVKGNEVSLSSTFINPNTGAEEELSADEYEAVVSFHRWCKDVKPTFIKSEFVVFGDGYAGTIDLLCDINGKKYIVDYKTSAYVWPSHELQVSAYKHAGFDDCSLGILQLGYKKNKNGYKFTEVADKYDLFKNVYQIFLNETDGERPRQIELPLTIKL